MRRERGLNRRFYQSLFLYERRGEKKREKEEDLVMGGACPECEKSGGAIFSPFIKIVRSS
jgi:hypothetical protein